MTGRQQVNFLIALNGTGFVLCGAAIGGLAKTEFFPWFSLVGIVFMFLGVVIPVYREFLSLSAGFKEVEREAIHASRLARGEKPYQEVIDTPKTDTPFHYARNQHGLTVLLTVLGWGCIAAEAVGWISRI